jgi:DNA mismatch repair protein MutS2
MEIYPKEAEKKMGWSVLLSQWAMHAENPSAKDKIKAHKPSADKDWVRRELQKSAEILRLLAEKDGCPLVAYPKVDKILGLLAIEGTVLHAEDCLFLLKLVFLGQEAARFFKQRKNKYPALHQVFEEAYLDSDISKKIENIVEPPNFVKSYASRALADIRVQLAHKRKEADKMFSQAVKKYQNLGWVVSFEEGYINNRRVIAVLSEYKRSIEGIVHGSSESGKTTYIEPYNLIPLHNELEELENEERREIHKILRELTQFLRGYTAIFWDFVGMLTELDFCIAKGKYAQKYGGLCPLFNPEKKISRYCKAYHPLLYMQNKAEGKTTLPFDLELNSEKNILIISGPNAGGKTITLKTIGLHQMMLQAGLPVPSSEPSVYTFYDKLFIDLGDDQSIEAQLSTYSARLDKMKYFTANAGENTLFFLDELGTGSDPELGGAMAEVMLEELIAKKATGVVTTHYANIKVLAEKHSTVRNACMLYDEVHFTPRYMLCLDQPGSSYTFEVAQKIGISSAWISRAKSKVNGQKVELDRLLHALQAEREIAKQSTEQLLQKQKELHLVQENYQKRLTDLEEKIKFESALREENQKFWDLGQKYQKFIERWLGEESKKEVMKSVMMQLNSELLKKRKEDEKKTQHKKSAKATKREVKTTQFLQEKLKVGSVVKLKDGKETGKILELEGKNALVQFGILKVKVPLLQLIYIR